MAGLQPPSLPQAASTQMLLCQNIREADTPQQKMDAYRGSSSTLTDLESSASSEIDSVVIQVAA